MQTRQAGLEGTGEINEIKLRHLVKESLRRVPPVRTLTAPRQTEPRFGEPVQLVQAGPA